MHVSIILNKQKFIQNFRKIKYKIINNMHKNMEK